ncbi:copper resistance CopC family protein [Actinoplanes sp. CA-051413]|uniref:copper resistance CopC family protein n=1 Tax=Actinoplanes sp. CA-051413 TaxID=3239899 RepID=UPI003D95BDD4
MRKLMLTFAAFAAVLLPGSPAWAHAELTASAPARDATLAAAPTSVTVTFSEHLNPEFTTIVVSDSARQRLAASAPVVDAGSGTVTLSPPPGNGTYTVAYRVVSVDGHTAQGSYAFTVADPALPPAPTTAPAVAAPPVDSGGTSTALLIGLGVLAVAITILLYVSWRRRTRVRA